MNGSNMPILRDVTVRHPEVQTQAELDGAQIASSKAAPGLVTVTGFDRKDVLFSSDRVGCVQWRDAQGEIVALLIRLKPEIWGFSQRGDEDWNLVLERYGNADSR